MALTLHFLGAARNVTGSRTVVDTGARRILIDCGLYQERALQSRNWQPLAVPPADLDAVLLTHGHLDHCGWLPRLIRDGFKGPVYCTPATAEIAALIMEDSGRIQEEDAALKRKRHEREGRTGPFAVEPLYTAEEARAARARFQALPYNTPLDLGGGLVADLQDAGHVLGSAMIRLRWGAGNAARTFIHSGDMGRWDAPILRDPTLFDAADYIAVESTYGAREHKSQAGIEGALAAAIRETAELGGNIVIPSFALERTQELLFHLRRLIDAGAIPALPVFVDSPMAIAITDIFKRFPELTDDETRAMIRAGRPPCRFDNLTMTRTAEESKAIREIKGSCIIIAGSGMCTGGRIKHHLINNLGDARNLVLFVGYQAQGTLGRILLERQTPEVRILGATHRVRARVDKINGFSGHAGRDELLRWVGAFKQLRRVFVVHGEPEAATALADAIHQAHGWPTTIPDYGDRVALD